MGKVRVENGKALGAPQTGVLARGSCRQASEKRGTLWGGSGMRNWLSLVGPKLKVGAKIREVVSY